MRFGWLALGLAIFILAASLRGAGYLRSLEDDAADVRSGLLQHEVHSNLVVIGIDARSLTELSEWPWPRSYHAQLIERLQQAAPRSVFLDLDFSSTSKPSEDARLEAALASWNGPPIMLPTFLQQAVPGSDEQLVATRPLPRFARYVDLASVNFLPSEDGLVRNVQSSWTIEGHNVPSVVAAVSSIELPPEIEMPIDFSISPDSFEYYSYSDVLAGRVDPGRLRGKTIFVGVTALQLGDVLQVPVYGRLQGVRLLALAAASVKEGPLRTPTNLFYLPALALWALLCSAAFCAWSWRRNLVALACSLALIATSSIFTYDSFRWIVEIVPLALVTVGAFMAATLKSLDEQTIRVLTYALGIRRRDALLKSIVDSSTDCIVCIDANGRIQTANPAATRLFACQPEALLGTAITNFVPELPQAQSLAGTVSEWPARTLQGMTFPVELSISRVNLNDEQLFTAIVRDISERKAQQRELEYQAMHDPLTALPNRVALAAHLDRVLERARKGKPVALLMLDLCRFKEVNDTLGHNVGDKVLCEVAERFRRTIGENGFIARIGGDEFTVVLDDLSDTDAVAEASRKLHRSLRFPIDVGGVAIDVGLSIGIALYPLDALDAQTLLKHADVAMYVSKRRGSSYECYDAAHDQHSIRRLTMVAELRAAIAAGTLALHYQPKIDLRTGRVQDVEALLRWQHPKFGGVSPAEFIAVAESTDLIIPLTEWTLREALAQVVRWRKVGHAMRVAVNLSARMLQDTDFPGRLRALLARSEIGPDALEIEITESAMMLDPARALRVIREIHELGVLISIDDYGTGFSSLGYLRDLPVHSLKIDRSFVSGMNAREDNRVIVRSTIQMAHALGLRVVAEGVETEWDAQFLASCGCDFGQGFLYSAALPQSECLDWIEARNSLTSRHMGRPASQYVLSLGAAHRAD